MVNMACTLFRLTVPEALDGVTVHAARALGLQDTHGAIAPGMPANFVLWNVREAAELAYWFGQQPVRTVVRQRMTHTLFAADALLPEGWAKNVLLTWDDVGRLTQVQSGTQRPVDTQAATGPVVPGMPNLHSHAFQRAFAGLTEHRAEQQDSFWSWRTLMYRFAARLGPQHMEAIATWLYTEMLEAGYTGVCEFQYVHHDVDGRPYADDATLSLALLRAAKKVGIGFTLLPVLYQTGGFGDQPPTDGQRRFI
eukprot:gene57195-78377_t